MSKLIIVDRGLSDYRIVVSREASPSEKHGANELRDFLKEISGAELPVVTDENPMVPHETILGDNVHLRQLGVKIDWDILGPEGFVIRTIGNCLVIAGGRLRGTMYGVYTFLEDYLGCRWFSSRVSRVPKLERVEVGPINDTQVPILEYRDVHYTDAFDADWSARNKVNSSHARLDGRRGGKVTYHHFVHTFYHLLPPQEFFEEHPEYYSEIDGRRTAERAQLCLTNPDVIRIAAEQVGQWIKEVPEASIYSVSQNDWWGWCQCEKCKAMDEREGSRSGTILQFVNQMAEAIEKEHPDKALDTLAYSYSRKPPKTIRPRKNVIVRLCSIECCFSHPLEECNYTRRPSFRTFRGDLRNWSKIAKRLYVWDYITNFSHYIQPFPNLQVLKPNIQFFVKHNVKGVFEEGNYSPGGGGEFAELRAYILAMLLWNPDYDVEKAINEFLEGYYGQAAPPIREYIDMLHQKVRDAKIHVDIRSPPTSAYLSPDIVKRARELFDEAERLAENEEILFRVRVARLPIQYVEMSNLPENDSKRKALIDRFFEVVERAGITHISEGMTTEVYKTRLKG